MLMKNMTEAEKKSKYIRILTHIGGYDALIQLAEECSELSQVCMKILRLDSENLPKATESELRKNLEEEVADVLVAIRFLKTTNLVEEEVYESIADNKLDRWCRRLEGEWEE